jgi:D-threo-aldose 1-dehydrogenase
MEPTNRRRLGKSALTVTQFGFGTAPLGGFRAAIPERVAQDTIAAAHDAGLRFFDTSPYYGYGRSELRLGAVLRDRPRGDLVVSTKIGRWMQPKRPDADLSGWRPGGLNFVPRFDYSYDGVMRSLEQSLLRLGMERVDVLFIHDVDFWTTRDQAVLEQRFAQVTGEGFRALDELRRAGVIGAVGVGLNESAMSARFVRAIDLDCVLLAGRYTLLEQGALDDFLPLCAERDVGVVIGGPFNSGILATGAVPGARYDYGDPPASVIDNVRRIEAVCGRHGVPIAAAALQFPLAHPCVSATIPGAMNVGEVESNLKLFRTSIPAALWQELRHEGLLDARAPVPG